jgi:hypothetical protein
MPSICRYRSIAIVASTRDEASWQACVYGNLFGIKVTPAADQWQKERGTRAPEMKKPLMLKGV